MKRRLIILMAAAVPATAVLVPAAANAVNRDSAPVAAKPAASCTAMPVSAPSGTKVVSVKAVARAGGDFTFPQTPGLPPVPPINDVPAWCDVNVVVTHPGAKDSVKIKISLPQDKKDWNGRFQATGGSAYSAGDVSDLSVALIAAVKGGFAGAATDAGVGAKGATDASWGLTADGKINEGLLTNFASRSVHDLAVIGKSVTTGFYKRAASYSYFTGCSTGGRQGYAEAQNYPKDFDGILANAPAIEWNRFEIATLWSQAVFNEEKVAPSQCELAAFNTAAVAACDTVDGVKDGVIADPQACSWDARQLVGKKVVCDGNELTISKQLATAVNKIWAGPVTTSGKKLWYGQNKGSSFAFIANPGKPFAVPDQWAKYFVTKNPSFDATKLTYESFEKLFNSATRQFDGVIGDRDPNLSKFAKAGGKLLTWHGQADQLIPTQGTTDYRKRVNAELGGSKRVDNFYRVFLLPGVDHCGTTLFSTGGLVKPGADLNALINWVENGKAPAYLPTTKGNVRHS
ncbi:tannase/feruloyl esterase family alpha/beta hydrolase [Actinoplanes solisilvae]|uniref:tannase/feruloyl esterase family alpha/beta hydrolase n=1 Tax=Actinoplanes solisilvae TaxID=2486853 RepID=UPI000FD804F9|nr:tannase/feruloyl esterase family alpha/beta hydrolase [Actinoplanes solisilvae]